MIKISFGVQSDLTRWIPLRLYPGSDADLQPKSKEWSENTQLIN